MTWWTWGRQVLIHKIGGCWESISRKSNMSMDPLPLKSNAEAWRQETEWSHTPEQRRASP